MTRIDFRPWACIALCVAILAYVGCSSSSPTGSSSPSSTGPAGSKGDPAQAVGGSTSKKPLANLRDPAAVLIVSAEQLGYMEPCGCTEGQIGGLIRRYDLVERLHNQNHWPTALIDLGSLMKNPADPRTRGGVEQIKLKFSYSLRALKLMNYSALALSADDLKLGVGEALGLFLNDLGDTTKVVVANVEAPDYGTFFRPSLIVPAGPVKLGVTAVIDPEALKKLNDPDKDVNFPKIQRPDEVLPGVLADLEPKSDYQVLMVQGPPALARRLAEAYPGFDIVVSTSDYDDVLKHEAEMLNNDKTMLVSVGRKGKYVGVFGLYPKETERLRYQVVTLDKKYDGPATAMKKLIEDEFRDTLRVAGVVENYVRTGYARGAPGAIYVGADNCKSCHPNTYMKWSTTKHVHAFEAVEKDPKPNSIYDAECITCHTTGFEYTSGWVSKEKTPYLAGNQCENCHGPGSKHVEEPDNVEFRKLMAVTAEQANKNQLCTNCHDGDNSPHFDFATYYGKIVHKALDDYKDPKAHRGFAPKLPRSSKSPGPATGTPEPAKNHP
ncbi:MAG: multiheme c-type cytochrome [Isosphaeraceae bacterium]